MLDREPDRELKVDLDGKLVVPNIIELTCIQPDTILVFQQSKTLVAIYWQCHCKKNCEETYETDRLWCLSMQTWWQTAKMVLLVVFDRGWLQRVPCTIYGELRCCSQKQLGRACKKLIRGLEETAEWSSSWFWHHPDLCWMSGPSSGRLENVIARQGQNILRWLETIFWRSETSTRSGTYL